MGHPSHDILIGNAVVFSDGGNVRLPVYGEMELVGAVQTQPKQNRELRRPLCLLPNPVDLTSLLRCLEQSSTSLLRCLEQPSTSLLRCLEQPKETTHWIRQGLWPSPGSAVRSDVEPLTLILMGARTST